MFSESITIPLNVIQHVKFVIDNATNDVEVYFNDVLKNTMTHDASLETIQQIRIKTIEAHFHYDNIQITTPSYNPTVYSDDFEGDLYGEYLKYAYNTDDERILQVSPTEITRYITSGGKTLAEYDGVGNLKYNYVYGNGQKLARVDDLGVKFYYHNDYLGSTRMLTNASGGVEMTRDYYPFGAQTIANGEVTDYKFCGKERDDDIDLDYSWHRYYDFNQGRFTQVDPLWLKFSSQTPYNYTMNNPLKYVDPDGRARIPTFGIIHNFISAPPKAQAIGLGVTASVVSAGSLPTLGVALAGTSRLGLALQATGAYAGIVSTIKLAFNQNSNSQNAITGLSIASDALGVLGKVASGSGVGVIDLISLFKSGTDAVEVAELTVDSDDEKKEEDSEDGDNTPSTRKTDSTHIMMD